MQIIACLCLDVALLWTADLPRVSPCFYLIKQVLKMDGCIVWWCYVQNKVPSARGCKIAIQRDGYNLVFSCGNRIVSVKCRSHFLPNKRNVNVHKHFQFSISRVRPKLLNSFLPFKSSPADLNLTFWELFKDSVPKNPLCSKTVFLESPTLEDVHCYFPLTSSRNLILMTHSKFIRLGFVFLYLTIIQHCTVLDIMKCLEMAV